MTHKTAYIARVAYKAELTLRVLVALSERTGLPVEYLVENDDVMREIRDRLANAA